MSDDVFNIIQVENQLALPTFDKYRKEFATTGIYPFLIGNDQDLVDMRDMIEPPDDGGAAFIAQAGQTDVAQWLDEMNWKKPKSLAPNIPRQGGFSVLSDVLSGEAKPLINIGLIQIEKPWHIFAKLGFGGWNSCPDPAIHVALHEYWNARHGAIPVAVTDDIVECFVVSPPDKNADILTLAGQQHAYCPDLVEQGYGSKPKLAASLAGAKVWYFWWD